MFQKDIFQMKRMYWIYSYLIGYLCMQLHEILHWTVARLFGFSGTVAIYSYSMSGSGEPWKFALVGAAGTLSTILYEIAGLILFRSRNLFLKRTGFILVFTNTIGRVLYEFSEFVIGMSGDEANVAQQLGISPISLRVPVTLFCILVLFYVINRDTQTGMKTVSWAVILTSSFVAVIITVLALGSVVDSLTKTGSIELGANLWGYPLYLVLINAAMISGVLLLVMNRKKYLAVA
jgi:hypothetical protein